MNTTKASPQGTNRKTATIVGVLFIIGTVAGVLSVVVMGGILGAPDYLNMVASNASQVALGALLMLVMGLALAMVPAMMFPILKRQNEALAIGYVIFRGALETFTYIALAMCWLLLVVVARQYADSGAAVASQFSSLGILLVKAPDPIMAIGHRLRPRRPDVLLPVVSSETHSAMDIRLGDCCGRGVFGRGLDRHVQHGSGHLADADCSCKKWSWRSG